MLLRWCAILAVSGRANERGSVVSSVFDCVGFQSSMLQRLVNPNVVSGRGRPREVTSRSTAFLATDNVEVAIVMVLLCHASVCGCFVCIA